MSRYIDADNYKKDLIQLGFLPALVVSVLDKQPTADVVEVVRCKDCKYFKMAGTTPICNFYKGLATTVNPLTDYCSYGERSEG